MSYIGNAPAVVPVERQISGVNVGTIVTFPYGRPAPAGYLKADGHHYSKTTYPDLFNYLGSEYTPNIEGESRIGDVVWFPKRPHIHADFVPADGQLLNISDYPDVQIAILGDKIHQTTDTNFSNDVKYRGFWMTDLPDVFRVPDMNGKSLNSIGSVFVRGDGTNSNGNALIQTDAIRNITGGSSVIGSSEPKLGAMSGAFRAGATVDYATSVTHTSGYTRSDGFTFDVSRVVPTANENRPTNLAGCWAVRVKVSVEYYIKAAGYIENEGIAKIGGLVETDSRLQKQIDTITEEFHMCTLSHTGTGDIMDSASGTGSGVFKIQGTGDLVEVVDGSSDNADFSISVNENPIITIKKTGTYVLQYSSFGNHPTGSTPVSRDRRIQLFKNGSRFAAIGGRDLIHNPNFSRTMQLKKGDTITAEVWAKLYYASVGHNGYSIMRIR